MSLPKGKFNLPPVIYGTSALGNLYEATSYENKLAVVKACMGHAPEKIAVFDSAGKYGAGLALENLSKCLVDLKIAPDQVVISNKLGWYQIPLTTEEPQFEPGVWKELKHDAIQRISYEGILACYEQGNKLLAPYRADLVSIHDPDEYLASASSQEEANNRYHDILEAYRALNELKDKGLVHSVGIGSKDWKVIKRIHQYIRLDWVMIANSLTIHSHPLELLDFIKQLAEENILVINSAIFNGGFLVGSDYYNYQLVDKQTAQGKELYNWRERFYAICAAHHVLPAEACFNFGFHFPAVKSVALNTTKAEKVAHNVAMATKKIDPAFWEAMRKEGLLS